MTLPVLTAAGDARTAICSDNECDGLIERTGVRSLADDPSESSLEASLSETRSDRPDSLGDAALAAAASDDAFLPAGLALMERGCLVSLPSCDASSSGAEALVGLALLERGVFGGLAVTSAGSVTKALAGLALALIVRGFLLGSASCIASSAGSVVKAVAGLALVVRGFLVSLASCDVSSAGSVLEKMTLVEVRRCLGCLARCEASPVGSGTKAPVDLALVARGFLASLASCEASGAASGTDVFPA